MRVLIITILAAVLLAPCLLQGNIALTACSSAGGNSAQGEVLSGAGEAGSCSSGSVNSLVKAIVNILSIIVGAAAVIMVIYSGFRYITSGGDGGRVASAKNALIYALIGLVIAALAQFIVHFVLSKSIGAS